MKMGSGFMTHAIDSLKNNRRYLREKNKRFRKGKTTTAYKKKSRSSKKEIKNSWRLEMADKKRQNDIKLELGILAFIILIGTIVLLKLGSKFMTNQLSAYHMEIEKIEASERVQEQKEVYLIWIRRGNAGLARKDWREAHRCFYRAIKLFPNGKKANLGLTKSLIYQCKQEKKYCEEATAYYNQLIALDVYSEHTIRNLSALKVKK